MGIPKHTLLLSPDSSHFTLIKNFEPQRTKRKFKHASHKLVCDNIRYLRSKYKLSIRTAEALSDYLGIRMPMEVILRAERIFPRFETIEKLAALYSVSIPDILTVDLEKRDNPDKVDKPVKTVKPKYTAPI